VVAQDERSRARNRAIAVERFCELMREALRPPPPPRRATKPSRSATEQRLETKRRAGTRKRLRRPPAADE
jgi:ribosome-associated protein